MALSIVRDQWDESIVKNALAHELRKAGIPFVREKRARVYYDGIVMGEYSADLLVDSRVMVEVKPSARSPRETRRSSSTT